MRIPGLKRAKSAKRWLTSRLQPHGLILGYHRIAAVDPDPLQMSVTPERFGQHLEVVRRLANPIHLARLIEAIQTQHILEKAVVVTFDDGYADLRNHALPPLARYDIPATVFVVTSCLGGQFPWDAPDPKARVLTEGELRELSASDLIDIGSHSVSHPRLANLPQPLQEKEISESKIYLEKILGQRITAFSYPNGSTSQATAALVKRAGYDCACTSGNDVVSPGSDLYRLPRFWIPNWDGATFERWLRKWM